MLFMIIETFRDADMVPIYQRVRDSGRSIPAGLVYIDSWVEPNFSRCFQLMECDDLRRIQEWVLQWRGSGDVRDRAGRDERSDPRSRRPISYLTEGRASRP
jgi:Protein of unknown function (DUF3303)